MDVVKAVYLCFELIDWHHPKQLASLFFSFGPMHTSAFSVLAQSYFPTFSGIEKELEIPSSRQSHGLKVVGRWVLFSSSSFLIPIKKSEPQKPESC